jgi:hypothetical protein
MIHTKSSRPEIIQRRETALAAARAGESALSVWAAADMSRA